MKFTKEQHKTWETLFLRQIENIKKFACREFITGFNKLDLPSSRIPSLEEINEKLVPATGWRAIRTPIRYLSDKEWSGHMSRKEFPITNFIRNRKELDFTPEPDIFHDVFGHLPLLMDLEVAKLIETFSLVYNRANDKRLRQVSQLWWNTIEFGLTKRNARNKAFGAGLMSSFGEIKKATGKDSLVRSFSIERGIESKRAVYSFHNKYLVFNSVKKLNEDLRKFFTLEPERGMI